LPTCWLRRPQLRQRPRVARLDQVFVAEVIGDGEEVVATPLVFLDERGRRPNPVGERRVRVQIAAQQRHQRALGPTALSVEGAAPPPGALEDRPR
jgi:hypothetical protein